MKLTNDMISALWEGYCTSRHTLSVDHLTSPRESWYAVPMHHTLHIGLR